MCCGRQNECYIVLIADGKKKTKPRVPKGFLMSSNAYMLVYTQTTQTEEQDSADKKNNETEEKTGVEWILPEQLNDLVKTEDQKFEDWVKEMNETKVLNWKKCISQLSVILVI